MPTLTQLEYVVAVDTHRHFGKAAKACHVSQPTLSSQLAKLEEETRATLFDRSKQPVLPTPEGERLLAQARTVIAELRRFESLVRDETSAEIQGPFRLGVIPTVSPYLVPLFLGAFLKSHPLIELSIEELNTSALLLALEQGKLDAGILATPFEGIGFDVQVLYDEPFYVSAWPGHPLASKPFVTDKDIPTSDLWLLSDGHCLRGQVLSLCGLSDTKRPASESKSTTCSLPVRFESGNLETLARLVEGGLGLKDSRCSCYTMSFSLLFPLEQHTYRLLDKSKTDFGVLEVRICTYDDLAF
jgi:LysR family transcriptional regulator, hydrogen peroxide-inducible genes activator